MNQTTFTLEEIMKLTEAWLVTGKLNAKMLAEDFIFTSPFWSRATKAEFIEQFQDPKAYEESALSKIIKFDPVLQLKDAHGNYFSIILQYHTRNGEQVYEAVLGKVAGGLLVELRSIYDLGETKKALELAYGK